MIRNVVFDFGQVMVHFDPHYMVTRYVPDGDDAALLEAVVFDRLYWDRLDDGSITDDEVKRAVCARLPVRLHEVATRIYDNWIYNLPEVKGMRALAEELRRDFGVHLYLLSNIGVYFAAHASEIPVLSVFERCFFSAVVGKVKPSADIFAMLCEQTGALPEETVFIDDNEKNIRGAREFGIVGYLFDGDVAALRTYLDELLAKNRE